LTKKPAHSGLVALNRKNHENCHQKVAKQIKAKNIFETNFGLLKTTYTPKAKNNIELIKGGNE